MTTDLIPTAAYVAGLEAALRDMLQAVCGPTGFAEAVRHNSGHAYPWHSLDAAEAMSRAALSARPDAPDVRVVPAVVLVEIAIPIEAMLISGQNSMSDEMFMAFQKSADCIRAIIGGMK